MGIPPFKRLGMKRDFDIERLVYKRSSLESKQVTWSERSVMGLYLPDWQRGFVWDLDRQVRFIESLYLDMYSGVYVVNAFEYDDETALPIKFSGALLDGQQRITTIERYLDDEFKVFGLYWSELSKSEQRRFMDIPFPCVETNVWDEEVLRDISDRLAYGGVLNDPSCKALDGYSFNECD